MNGNLEFLGGLDPEDTRPASQQIADRLRAAILWGKLAPDERLPPQQLLADRFGVARETVKRALEILRRERLVVSRQGSGVFVRRQRPRPSGYLAVGTGRLEPYIVGDQPERRRPSWGEIWRVPVEVPLLRGGQCLVVSADRANANRDERIVVEVIAEQLVVPSALLVDLGPHGAAVIGSPVTLSATWFAGALEPVAVLDPALATEVCDRLRALLGPDPTPAAPPG